MGVADFDFVFTLANSISNTQNHLYMRENPCISLNDEQRRRIEELIELIWRRERSQGYRSTNENNRLIYNQLLSSLGKALCCEIAEAYFFNHPIQPLKQDRKDRIFQSFIFSLSQNFRTQTRAFSPPAAREAWALVAVMAVGCSARLFNAVPSSS